jgi:hypothetical protein
MMKLAVTATLLATVGVTCTASAQAPPQEQTIVRAGTQPSTQGPEQYFTGKSVLIRCSRPAPMCPTALPT